LRAVFVWLLYDKRHLLRGGRSSGGSRVSLLGALGDDGAVDLVVNGLSALGGRKDEPDGEDSLENVVVREPVDGINQVLEDREATKHCPVGQPLNIISSLRGLQSLQAEVSGKGPSENVAEEAGANVEEDEEGEDAEESDNGVGLRDLSLGLEVVERRVLGQLLVDLGDVVVKLVLSGHVGLNLASVKT